MIFKNFVEKSFSADFRIFSGKPWIPRSKRTAPMDLEGQFHTEIVLTLYFFSEFFPIFLGTIYLPNLNILV